MIANDKKNETKRKINKINEKYIFLRKHLHASMFLLTVILATGICQEYSKMQIEICTFQMSIAN